MKILQSKKFITRRYCLFFFLFLININISLVIAQTNTKFKPLNMLIDISLAEILEDFSLDIDMYRELFNKIINILSQIINVEPITENNPIKLDFDKFSYLNISKSILNGTLINGISDYDLIVIANFNLSSSSTSNITVLNRDTETKRPTLGYLLISNNEIFEYKTIEARVYYLLHYMIELLGFSYENFQYFTKNGENIEVYYNKIDNRSQLLTNYIKTEKVLEIAKKYYNCTKIEGIPLENQDENKIALWDARILLGDIMSTHYLNYEADQVISEFTLALLEDSGWYEVNYYTSGLMRFGKNKGCDFLFDDCSNKFKNEFCDYGTKIMPSCSSGRQTLTYCNYNYYNENNDILDIIGYKRYDDMNRGVKEVDFCIINEPTTSDNNQKLYIGKCKYIYNQNNKYGTTNSMNTLIKSYSNIYQNRDSLVTALSETYSNNSFCVLVSMKLKNDIDEPNFFNMVQPICYEMYCSNDTLTIGINNQFIACPRKGGKVEIKGDYKGYIYCPDYNLICTGTVLCNDMFDCIEKKSLIKNTTYYYDYDINTSQNQSDLINATILIGYEISTNGKCRQNCSQCFDNYTCFTCRENYYLIGDYYGQNISEINCISGKDISVNYFTFDDIYYYPCLSKCEKCMNDSMCEKCDPGYYFIEYNRTYCDTGKNLSKYYTDDHGISYFPCYKNFDYCDTCTGEKICTRCQDNYYFLSESHSSCEKLEDKSAYFTEDGGITYLLCNKSISNCYSCSNRTYCTKCEKDYYMIGDNRNRCYNNYITNFNEYYTEDGGVSYYPCDTHFPNCLTCENKNTCTQCRQDYDFIRGKKEECFTLLNNRTYIDNIDHFRYPCYDSFNFCDKCTQKGNCFECFANYSFTYDYTNNGQKIICDKIDISKYYLNDKGVYELCNKTMDNCDECANENSCTKCVKDFYFLRNDYSKCLNDLDIRKYYSENNYINVYPCNEAMNQCDYCSNKTICEKCYDNFYLYKNIMNNCIALDNLEKYYKKGISYYPCDESITNCNKCSEENICYECNNNLVLIYQDQNICREENSIINDKSLFKYNDTFYMKCSDYMEHCTTCEKINSNKIICAKCEDDFYYVNENRSQCVNINEINSKNDEYIKINATDYYTCDYKGVNNCLKCKNFSLCDLCQNNYAFANNNYSVCYRKSDMEKGYYHDFNEIMYYSCIINCDLCTNNKECLKCRENYLSFENNKFCGKCELNMSYINNKLTQDLIQDLTNKYINLYENIFSFVDMYVNPELNFNIILFRASVCTELIYELEKKSEINLDEFIQKIFRSNIVNDDTNNYMISYINNNYKTIIQLYSFTNEGTIKINISEICSDCDDINYIKIKKNFAQELNNELSYVIQKEIIDNEYNIFNKDEKIFNDLCYNFNIKNIDIPINERRKIFYLGNKQKEYLCNDINCEITNIFMKNTTSLCECKIKTEFEYLFEENMNDEINEEEYEKYIQDKKNINSFMVFTCAKEAFDPDNLKNNIALYISCGFIVIQLVLLIIYSCYKKKRKKVKSNPPKLGNIGNFSISDDFEEDEKGDAEQKNQKKEIINYEKNTLEEEEDEEGDDIQNIQGKDIDSARARDIENVIKKRGLEINEEILKIEYENYQEKRNQWGTTRVVGGGTRLGGKLNKLKFLEEESYGGDENKNKINKIKSRGDKLYSKKRLSTDSKESLFSKSDINDIQNDLYQKTEYIRFTDAIKKREISFSEYYFKLIQLKQPIIALFSPIKRLKLEESNIPTLVKIMRIILILCINLFFNIFHLTQNYFSKKLEHFNNKYNIIYEYNEKKISSNEIFAYAMGHTILSGFISFIICLIIQSLINYFIFNVRKNLNKLADKNNKNTKEKINKIISILNKAKKKFIIFFSISFIIMIIIFYLMINFNEVYRGGILDLIGSALWTFIFLQIFPFIYCLVFAFIRYLGIKKKNEKMYKFSQIIFF